MLPASFRANVVALDIPIGFAPSSFGTRFERGFHVNHAFEIGRKDERTTEGTEQGQQRSYQDLHIGLSIF
jgi:hypothetical protein